VKQPIPEIPSEPVYLPVSWSVREKLYCVSEDDAKALGVNVELMRGYSKDMRLIFEGLKEK